jgi:hypothetical protein
MIEDFPQLLEKWQGRGNKNCNPNNQNISTKILDKGPKIVVVTHEGTKIGMDTINVNKSVEKLVKKSEAPTRSFDPKEDKKTYRKSRK